MSRLFGIAGVQMSVVPWDANATFAKMSDLILNIRKQFPWVDMIVFHELVVPALVQFVTPDDKDWRKKNSGPVPGPQTDRLCQLARKANRWLIPGSMWEIEERCSRGCLMKLALPQASNSASSMFPAWAALGCASVMTCGSLKWRARWHGWAQKSSFNRH